MLGFAAVLSIPRCLGSSIFMIVVMGHAPFKMTRQPDNVAEQHYQPDKKIRPLEYYSRGPISYGERSLMFRTTLIAVAIAVGAPVHAQVRVITGDIEHIYGTGGQILDDDALRAQNQRAERMKVERDRLEAKRRQQELDAASAAHGYQEQESAEGGSYYPGAFFGRWKRHANLRHSGVVSGSSSSHIPTRRRN
jgi:hypothetical protein